MRADRFGAREPFGDVHGAAVGEHRDRADSWHRHEPSAHWIDPRHGEHLAVQLGKALAQGGMRRKQGFDGGVQRRRRSNQLADPWCKTDETGGGTGTGSNTRVIYQ